MNRCDDEQSFSESVAKLFQHEVTNPLWDLRRNIRTDTPSRVEIIKVIKLLIFAKSPGLNKICAQELKANR
jgi:hypothetical protein